MKRFLPFLLVFTLIFSIVPVPAQAQGDPAIQKFRVSVDGKAYQADGYLDSSDGELYFPPSVIQQMLGTLPPATERFNGVGYASLRAACDGLRVSSYEYEPVLKAAYIWRDLGDQGLDEARISYYNLGTPSSDEITYQQFFAILDTAVAIADNSKLAAWQSQFAQGRLSVRVMTRYEGMLAILNAATLLGADFSEFNVSWSGLNEKIGNSTVWTEIGSIPDANEFIPNHYPYALGGFQNAPYIYGIEGGVAWDDCGVAYRYAFGRVSHISNKTLFDYDETRNSMRPADAMTFTEALNAVARLLDSRDQHDEYVSLSSAEAVNRDKTVLSDDLINKAKALPEISDEDLPQWHGFVLPDGSYERTDIDTMRWDKDLRNIADWGFNSVRYMLTYQTLFDDSVTQVNLTNLKKLDMVVASAIKYHLHLNIVTFSMPGRWTRTDFNTYITTASLDLFTNAQEQEQAKAVWALLAQRYKDVPSASLSFTPLWEAQNTSLSSGLPVDPYTIDDVDKVYCDLIGTIRAKDPDRFVVYEPTPNNTYSQIIPEAQKIRDDIEANYSHVLMMSNFCEQPFVYAEMTSVQGQHIDHYNHSMFKPPYPVTVYGVQQRIDSGAPLTMDGTLAAGTVIDIYLSKVEGAGTFRISADGADLYTEGLTDATYSPDYPLSRYYPYAQSDKHISVTLSSNAANLQISYSGNAFEWSGIDVTLPPQYAVDRWWYTSFYDAAQAHTDWTPPSLKSTSKIMISPFDWVTGRNITIHPDVTYTTDAVVDQANKQTIENWGNALASFTPKLLVRAENAQFSIGSEYQSTMQYYDDFMAMCEEHGFSWFSNEFNNIFWNSNQSFYSGAVKDRYQDGYLLTDMLKTFQKYLPQLTSLEAAQGCLISATPDDSSRGSITGDGTYDIGATASLHAERKPGYRFVRWTEGDTQVSTSADYSFTVTAARSLTAEFSALAPVGISYTKTDATAYGAANGSISLTATGGDSGTHQYSRDGGAHWQSSGQFDAVGAGNYTAMVRDAEYPENTATCAVTIGQPSNTASISATPNNSSRGTVTGGGTFTLGDTATLHAERKPGYRFVRWTEGDTQVSGSADYSFTVSAARSLTAEFVPLTPVGIRADKTDATVYGAADGSISITASSGDSGTYQYSKDGGTSWQSSGQFDAVGAGAYTMMVRDAGYPENTASCTVTIGQPSNTASISATPNDGSRGTVTGGGTFTLGTTASLHAARNAGYRFVRWTEGGSPISGNADYSFTVTAARSLTAEFAPLAPVGISYTKADATIYGAANGSISLTASGGDSGTYQYSKDGGTSWQSTGLFGSVGAGTYTVMVRDAGYPENTAMCPVAVGQPSFVGNIAAAKLPAKANAGSALSIVPSAAKGYTVQSVSYSSSNRSVANVDASGSVTFLCGGKVTITIKIVSQTTDKTGKTKTATTTIKKTITVNQPVAAIALSRTAATIAKNAKVKLTANIAPGTASNKKVKWTSSNPKVATVSANGDVTGKAAGTATITCTAQDGSRVSASCTVTVTPVYPSKVKLSKTALTIKPGKTGALSATVSPSNTDFKTVSWASSNPGVAAVDSKGKIKGLSPGTATITVTTSNGLRAACIVTIK